MSAATPNPTESLTAAQVIARRLKEAGVRHAFGMPGGEILTMMDALDEAGIDFVLVKHENCGGFMAEGTYHRTHAPGVLLATVGPGAANAFNVVANAQQDRVPLIFLTGRVDPSETYTYTHQVFDHAAAFRPIVKATFTAATGAIDVMIDKAVAIALEDPPGPVHIDIPIAVARALEPAALPVRRAKSAPMAPAATQQFAQAREWIAQARKPVVLAGVEVLSQQCAPQVADLIKAHRLPLITTYKAKGIVDERDPLALGGAGLSPHADQVLIGTLQEADLIVLAGYDPIEMRAGWRDPWPRGARVIEVAAMPNTHYVHQAPLSFIGHVGETMVALFAGQQVVSAWTSAELDAKRHALAEIFRTTEEWGPAAIVDTVRRTMPPDTLASADSGAHRILLSQVWQCSEPHGLMQSTGLCTMGCAVPLAMGAKLASPQRPVVSFSGDAGFEMVLGELATARDRKIGVICVVFVDQSLALIELKQRSSGMRNLGVEFGATDFAGVARALGGVGFDVDSRETLADALRQSMVENTFSIIACHIQKCEYDGRI
ncbi:MAG: thiamine pyrophosphate-binding protein [Rubrivivax sp.]|nr:thiamine pyrophosphate-binding protein [Rubrivivax sp.]MBK7260466.1 thiamine pyrophosphate-binding protein [Rubrivivax sp.]MBK8526142.1 thiamine pyrophosphate-binding protein [Rubrivivax sp.]